MFPQWTGRGDDATATTPLLPSNRVIKTPTRAMSPTSSLFKSSVTRPLIDPSAVALGAIEGEDDTLGPGDTLGDKDGTPVFVGPGLTLGPELGAELGKTFQTWQGLTANVSMLEISRKSS